MKPEAPIKPIALRILLLTLLTALTLLVGIPSLLINPRLDTRENNDDFQSIYEISFSSSGEYKFKNKEGIKYINKILDPISLEPIEKQLKYARLIATYGELADIKRQRHKLLIPLSNNGYGIKELVLNSEGVLYLKRSNNRSRLKKVTHFAPAYFSDPTLFKLEHLPPVEVNSSATETTVKITNSLRPEVLFQHTRKKLYLLNLKDSPDSESAKLIHEQKIILPLPSAVPSASPSKPSTPFTHSADSTVQLSQAVDQMRMGEPEDPACGPCETESAGVCLPKVCESGRMCEVVNGQEQCSSCGDRKCQGNYESCSTCPEDCKDECPPSATPSPMDESEEDCTIDPDDNILAPDGQDVAIDLKPNHKTNSDATLRAIEIKVRPSIERHTNAAIKEKRAKKIEVEARPSESRAIIKNALWYGYGEDKTLCTDDILNKEQGVYLLEIKATFDDGCEATSNTTLDIYYPSFDGAADAQVTEENLFQSEITSSFEIEDGVWQACAKVVCKNNDCIKLKGYVSGVHPEHLQYHSIIMEEENFHVKQFNGEVGWELGGTVKNGRAISDNKLIIENYTTPKICAKSIRGEESAIKVATYKAERHAKLFAGYHALYFDEWIRLSQNRCWFEYMAKNEIGLTKDYAGFHYECTYLSKTEPNCGPKPTEPIFFWEWLKEEYGWFLPLGIPDAEDPDEL